MKYKFFIVTIIFSFMLSSCDDINNTSSKAGQISIVGILQTGSDKQYVKVCYFSDLNENGKYDSLVVKDAEVKIIGDDFTEKLLYGETIDIYGVTNDYFYESTNSIESKLLPGKTCKLYVKAKGVEINGTTKFPGKFMITSHKNNDTLDPNTNFRLNWSESEDAYLYIVEYGYWASYNHSGTIITYSQQRQLVTRDTTIDIPKLFYQSSSGETPLFGFVKVVAMDKNYYDHTYLMRDRAGLDNGYGCFSSGVVDTIKLYFKM
jgi:hypothetical protein